MSGDPRDTNPVVEKEAPSADTANINQPEKSEKKNYCYVCNVQCTDKKNLNQHLHGRKHIKKLNQTTRKKRNPSDKTSRISSKSHGENFKDKNQDIQNCVNSAERTNEMMNNSPNRCNQNNKYNRPRFDNKYSYYSSNFRSGKQFYNNRSYNWNSYSNSSRVPNAPDHNFNTFRPRYQSYSQSSYNASHPSDRSFRNNHSFFNPFRNYDKSSNYETFEENLEPVNNIEEERHETPILRNSFSSNESPSENPFKNFSEDVSSLLKTPNDLINHETNDTNTNKTIVSNPQKSAHFSGDSGNASKKRFVISRIGDKRVVFRSRSLSSSESDKKMKEKTDVPESEEQKIQEWTDSLLETNHNQITRLINPSNHKEKAAVNRLITKFSKTKRKENLTRTLRTNSSELTDNDIRNLNSEIEYANQDELNLSNTDDDEILIVSESSKTGLNLEQDFCSPSTSKTSTSNGNSTIQDQNIKNISKSSKSPINGNSKMYIRKGETIKVDHVISGKVFHVSNSKNKEKTVKRKIVRDDAKVPKKHKSTSFKNPVLVNVIQAEDLVNDSSRTSAPLKDIFCLPDSTKIPNQDSSVLDMIPGLEGIGGMEVDPTSSTSKPQENLVFSPDVSVDTLIQLFASGNVKVKEEFNDPIMDAIKEISPDELFNAYTNNSMNISEELGNQTTASSLNKKNSTEKSPSEVPMNKNNNSINPVILGSAAIEDDSPLSAPPESNSVKNCVPNKNASAPPIVQQTETLLQTASTSDKSELHNSPLSNADIDKNLDDSLLNELNMTKVELPPYLNKLIKELQDITSEEEKIKERITAAKSKISEYSSLLEVWKTKKKMLHEQEETLRKQRNSLINQMQNAVKTDNDDKEKEPGSSLLKDNTKDDQSSSNKKQKIKNFSGDIDASKKTLTVPSSLSGKQKMPRKDDAVSKSPKSDEIIPLSENQKTQRKDDSMPKSPESDEVVILPPPQKPKPLEIVICDDEESPPVGNQAKASRHDMDYHTLSNKKTTVYDLKSVDAHTTVINCLVVFEEYLYTCSNDNTAKRFSLKDSSLSVIYVHATKNVLEVVVEKMQNEALVFTSCSSGVISLFIASSGTKIKSFFPPCAVMSICKGWNRFYSGLANGTVNLYNWKYDEIEIVKTEQPASRIATAHQGRLHVLVILSSEGNISIRDAETGLLIRYVKVNIKHPSLMCLQNDLLYLSSADKTLSILDVMSGRIEKRLYMNSHTTGLAVYDNYIFTICYSGVINCYNKENSCDKRIFYGAGKGGLTCIHVYQNWVFTGNRKGDVALFYFDPNSIAPCEFSKCDVVYGLKEDLEYHVEKDHLQKKKMLSSCNWKGCNFKFPRGADLGDKMNHYKTHIYPMNCSSATLSC